MVNEPAGTVSPLQTNDPNKIPKLNKIDFIIGGRITVNFILDLGEKLPNLLLKFQKLIKPVYNF